MTPVQSVARAEKHQVWPSHLRISEVGPSPSTSLGKSQTTPFADLLRTAKEYLQAGWRWLERKRTQQLSARRLRLAETISLGEKRSVSIVQVDGAQYLIGCSTGSVQLLAVLDSKDGKPSRVADEERAS